MILCCDTCTDYAVFAVGDASGKLLASSTTQHRRDLSTKFFADMDATLAAAGVAFAEIDTLAVGIGPGSFTGVRVAVTTFRTLAQASGKRLLGFETLAAMAQPLALAYGEQTAVIGLLPSRRGEVYAAAYHGASVLRAPFAATLGELKAVIEELSDEGDVVSTGPHGLLGGDFSAFPHVAANSPSPDAMLQLAVAEVAAERWADPLGLNPLYIVAPAINQHKDPRTAERLAFLSPAR